MKTLGSCQELHNVTNKQIVKKYEKPIKMIVVTILDRVVLVMSLPVSFLIVIVEET